MRCVTWVMFAFLASSSQATPAESSNGRGPRGDVSEGEVLRERMSQGGPGDGCSYLMRVVLNVGGLVDEDGGSRNDEGGDGGADGVLTSSVEMATSSELF